MGRGCWCTAEELGGCVGMLCGKSMYSKKAISPEFVSVRVLADGSGWWRRFERGCLARCFLKKGAGERAFGLMGWCLW